MKKFITLLMVSLTILTGSLVAYAISADIASYITVKLDGNVLDMKDANGNKVEPIIVDGTTYLPVRAISNAFGKDIDWNDETKTISIGSNSEFTNLISVTNEGKGYTGSKVANESNLTFSNIGDIGVKYQTAIKLSDINSAEKDFKLTLNKNYSTLSCTLLFVPSEGNDKCIAEIKNNAGISVLSNTIEPNKPVYVENIDITGATELTFEGETEVFTEGVLYFLNPVVK